MALGIGLLLRPRLLNLNYLFDRKLEETDLMICEEEGMKREKISLSTAVKILVGQDEFRKTLNDKIEKFQSGYPKRIRRGFLAILIIPVIFLILMFSIDSKMVFLGTVDCFNYTYCLVFNYCGIHSRKPEKKETLQ